MKINNQNKQIHKILKNQLNLLNEKNGETAARQGKNNLYPENIEKMGQNTIHDPFSTKLLNMLAELNPETRSLVINNILKNNLSLDLKKIQNLIEYINNSDFQNNNTEKKALIIKAFTILMKNKVPVNKDMLSALYRTLNKEETISDKINGNQDIIRADQSSGNSSSNKDNHISNELMKKIARLIINPEIDKENLVEKISNYSQQIDETLKLLQNNNDENQQELWEQLLGQKIINLDEENTLLQLELPIYFAESQKLIPAYLSIQKQEQEKKHDLTSKDKGYKINFNISLEKRGLIKVATMIDTNSINSAFFCSQQETKSLIKENFPILKEKLEKLNFKVKHPQIKVLDNGKKENTSIESKDTIVQEEKEFLHIDIRI